MPLSPARCLPTSPTAEAVRAGQVLVVSAPGDLPLPGPGWPVLTRTPAVVVQAAPPAADAAGVAAALSRDRATCCYLDRIVLTAATPTACRALVPALYDVLGEAYELLADTGRNIAAAEWALAAVAAAAGHPPHAVLDVGCGSGLSLRARNRPPYLAGWDPSPVMRQLAAAAGMPVLEQLEQDPDRAWDAALACYVLHLPGAPDTVPQVLRLLRPGGLLAANLHRTADPTALPALCSRHGITHRVVDRHPLHGALVLLSRSCDPGAAS